VAAGVPPNETTTIDELQRAHASDAKAMKGLRSANAKLAKGVRKVEKKFRKPSRRHG
jgi:hypothetical protein